MFAIIRLLTSYTSMILFIVFISLFLAACEKKYRGSITCENGEFKACGEVTSPSGSVQGSACYDVNPFSSGFGSGGYSAAGNYGSILGSTIGDFSGNNQTTVSCNGDICYTTVRTTCADGHFQDVSVTCNGQNDPFGVGFNCTPSNNSYSGSIYVGGFNPNGTGGTIFGNINSQDGCTSGGGGCQFNWGNGSFGLNGTCGDGSWGAGLFLELCR